MYVMHNMYMHGGPEEGVNPLELELQMVMSCLVGSGI